MSQLQPLTCGSCRAPVPLGEANEVTCPNCGASQALPPQYAQLRDARKLSAGDEAALDAVVAELARPDPAWKTVMVWVGYLVGGFTLLVLAIGAVVGAVAGLFGVAKVEAEGWFAMIIIGICTFGAGLVSVPLVGELVFFTLRHGFDAGWELALGTNSYVNVDLAVGAVLYVFAVVPIALARRTQDHLASLQTLRGQLAARKLGEGGSLGCRLCGAPLTVAAGALAARCVYCEADNLVTVSAQEASSEDRKSRRQHRLVREALKADRVAKAEDRKLMLAMLIGGPALAPIVAVGGLLLHVLTS